MYLRNTHVSSSNICKKEMDSHLVKPNDLSNIFFKMINWFWICVWFFCSTKTGKQAVNAVGNHGETTEPTALASFPYSNPGPLPAVLNTQPLEQPSGYGYLRSLGEGDEQDAYSRHVILKGALCLCRYLLAHDSVNMYSGL